MKQYLLTPGPVSIPPQVALKEALPIIYHRSSEFSAIYKDITCGLKYIFQTKNDVYTIASSGTGAMEMAIVNLLSPDDEILVASCGEFGDRWIKIAQSYGVKVISLKNKWGNAVNPLQIQKILSENVNIKAVFTTFVETSTGVVNDIKAIGKIVANKKAIFVVDAISGLVGQKFKTDLWKVDVVISSSQKGFMTAPGLAFITLSNKAWKLTSSSKISKFYFDIKKYKKFYATSETPFTPPVTLIVALQESIKLIKHKKIENIWKDCNTLAKAARAGMKALGLKLLAENPSDVLTSAIVPENICKDLIKLLREGYGISIAGGHSNLKNKIIRLAHMSYIDKKDLIVGFSCLEMALSELGYSVENGKSIAAIEKELLRQ